MSLLGTQVYANADTPCWCPTISPEIQGGLIVYGGISCDGNLGVSGTATAPIINAVATFPGQGVINVGGALNQGLEITAQSGAMPTGNINTDSTLYFARKGTLTGGSTFIVPGAVPNTDTMTVGGNLTTVGTVSPSKVILPTTGAGPTAGKSFVPVGSDTVTVPTTAITANSIVLISRQGAPTAGPGAGANQEFITVPASAIVPGTSFDAYLVNDLGVNVAASVVNAEFSWVIIN